MATTWRASAACVGESPVYFELNRAAAARARAICSGCSVREPCLEEALGEVRSHGVRGGLTMGERSRLRWRRRRLAAVTSDLLAGLEAEELVRIEQLRAVISRTHPRAS